MKLLVFIFFLLVFLASNGGHLDVIDGKGYFLLTENLVLNKSLKIHSDLPSINETKFDIRNYFNWHYGLQHDGQSLPAGNLQPMYIFAPPLLPVLGIPFYLIAKVINFSPVQFTAYFLNSVILALSSTIVYALAEEIYKSRKIAFITAIFSSVCSFAWPYATSYFEQPIVGLTTIACIYFLVLSIKGKFSFSSLFCGLFLGLIALANVGYIILVPGIIIIFIYSFRKNRKKIFQFLFGLMPIVVVQACLNIIRFNSITNFGYGHLQSISFHSSIDGLYGMFISPGFGLMVNFPLIVLFPFAMYYLFKQNRIFFYISLYIFSSIWLFAGTEPSPDWHGLGAWGPRYLVPAIPILAISIGVLLKQFPRKINIRITFIMIASIGFFVNLLGILVWYQAGYAYAWGPMHIQQLPPPEYSYFEWSWKYIPVVLHWNVLTTDMWKQLPIPYDGWIPCIPDNFMYCHFGFVSSLILPIIIAIIGYIIIKKLRMTDHKIENDNR